MDSTKYDYPRTVDEMLEQGWYEKILKKVRKYTLNDILNTPEEITQDIFLQIMNSSYLERFNPELRSFEVYIYTLVINSIKKRGMREGSNGGKNIVNHYSLEQSQDDSEDQPGVAYLDRLENQILEDPFKEIMVDDLIQRTRVTLSNSFSASSTIVYNGKEINRDPLTVFNLILEDKTVPEIAEIFQTSKQFIYILLGKIRSTPEMQEFHRELEFNGGISNRGKRKKRSIQNATF